MSLLLIITITILSIQIPPSISLDDAEKYKNCSTTFRCGDLEVDLGYPFSGSTRPSYCGHPGFNLICSTGSDPIITINSIDYRIINVDNATQTIKIASSNYYDDLCPSKLIDTTIDLSLFNYTSSAVNLTLLYNCPASFISNHDYFTCSTDTIVVILPDYNFPTLTSGCTEVFVTISSSGNSTVWANPTNDTVLDAFDAGFELQWKIDNEVCNECINFGGGCGWDTSADAFACYCEKGAVRSTCGAVPGRSTGPQDKKTFLFITLSTLIPFFFLPVFLIMCRLRMRKRSTKAKNLTAIGDFFTSSAPNLQIFSLADIDIATNKFAMENKLGHGGYGPVYKGLLSNEQEVAVKKLSKSSMQGFEEFKNEVILTAKLQHVNLARVLGFCIDQDEQMLVYEYMPNKSLDLYLFDPIRRMEIDWRKRAQIIDGIIQGLLYLQEYSSFIIIHRDLKASNILLDHDLKPKISDFGMAKIFNKDAHEAITSQFAGTYGYVPPEYVKRGLYSRKTDVYSFGVLLLQIISGKKNGCLYGSDENLNLSEYAYELWREGHGMEFMDPFLDDTNCSCKLITCLHIALLCVQEDANDRPSMLEVSSMLKNETVLVPTKVNQPAFSRRRNEDDEDKCTLHIGICSVNDATMSRVQGR